MAVGGDLKRFGHHRNAFGFLRLAFALLVIASHVPEVVDGNAGRELLSRAFGTMTLGELAVNGFFIISGFLISASYLNSISIRSYLAKRVTRIFPAFIVASLICMLVVAPLGGAQLGSMPLGFYLKAIVHTLTLNPPDNPGAFAGSHYDGLNAPMWTIRYEFRCYLLVIALGMAGLLLRPVLLGVVAIVLIAVSPLASGDAEYFPAWVHAPLWLGIPSNTLKLTGMFLSGAAFRGIQDKIQLTGWHMLVAAVILVGCMFHPLLAGLGVATAGAYLIFGTAALGRGTILERINNKNDISYGAYLYAWPVQKLLIWFGFAPPLWLLGLCVALLAIGMGWLSWLLVEKPALQLVRRLTAPGRRPAPAWPATLAAMTRGGSSEAGDRSLGR
jgi:peptidoglycan/LPS O-acetylase OafA/YrhL